MAVMKPYHPINIIEKDNSIIANVSMRQITFGRDSLPTSIIADGEELLANPIRFIGIEDNEPMVWDMNDCFIFNRSDEEVVICGSMQSGLFIINTCITLGYDGCMHFDIKLVPRGKTVAEVFNMCEVKPHEFKIGSLIMEISLKKSSYLYHVSPNTTIYGNTCELIPFSDTSSSGILPLNQEKQCFLPHRPMLWLGDEKRGLCFFSESDENWQPADENRAIEICDTNDVRTLRLHLLDSHPQKWIPQQDVDPNDVYRPLSFSVGFEATPVKPFPKQPYLHNALHIDCFRKIEGDYKEYLAGDFGGENGYDRMKRLGVTTLILHEKWNKIQNFTSLSEPTSKQLTIIISECHKRGIKVIPYFGYELSSLSPLWTKRSEEALHIHQNGGWWRVPPQRAYPLCFASSWQDTFVEGIKDLLDCFHFDGIYLDTTLCVKACTNQRHGCGYIDVDGNLKPTYPIMANRNMLKRLYEIVESRDGIINYHAFGFCNIPSMGFTHIGWTGETIQFKLLKEGAKSLPLEHFRTEYTGRNFGIPQEFISYENRPKWTFEHGCALSIIHGILPRPNSIEEPLDFISNVWKIFSEFSIEKSKWVPYWENTDILTGDNAIKCSYYRHIDEQGKEKGLIFVANTTEEIKELKLNINSEYKFGTMSNDNEMPPFSFGIFIG